MWESSPKIFHWFATKKRDSVDEFFSAILLDQMSIKHTHTHSYAYIQADPNCMMREQKLKKKHEKESKFIGVQMPTANMIFSIFENDEKKFVIKSMELKTNDKPRRRKQKHWLKIHENFGAHSQLWTNLRKIKMGTLSWL